MKNEILKISELIFDKDLYPRMKTGFLTVYQYAQAMKAGSVFPPILVGLFENKKYVIDGWHRVEAKKMLGEQYVQANMKRYDDWKDMFVDAVKANASHGRQLSVQEKTRIIHKMFELGFEPKKISEIVHVPIGKLEVFKVRTIVGPNGKPVYLKSPLVKAKVDKTTALTVNQEVLSGVKIENLIEQLIELIEKDAVPLDKDETRELCVRLYTLLQEKLELTQEATS